MSVALLLPFPLFAKQYIISSPDGRLKSVVEAGEKLTFSLADDKQAIIGCGTIAMEFTDGTAWGANCRVKGVKRVTVDEMISSPFYKKDQVEDHYNLMTLSFKEGFDVEFRMYDEGLAYRFVSHSKGRRIVRNEIADYLFVKDFNAWVAYIKDRGKNEDPTIEQQLWNDMQAHYTYDVISGLDTGKLSFTPVVIDLDHGEKLCIAESDQRDYPGMYVRNATTLPLLQGFFAGYPKRIEQGGHDEEELCVMEREDYIAIFEGARTFPWRSFIVARSDTDLIGCDMVYRLAGPSRIEDTSWIKPGKVAWEWWNDWGLHGVDFEAGINTETYKHYVDFASRNGIEYIMLDAGWITKYKCDIFEVVPEIDLKEIIAYAKSRNVDVLLWAGYYPMVRTLEKAVEHYAEMGAKGFKIDFLNRDDQLMMQSMWEIAEVCARHKMIVDFHGCCKPTGLQRTYPNVLNYEAVFGLEQMKWTKPGVDQVTYDVTLPFIRQVAGPMDYTQGAMRNSIKGQYFPHRGNPMSQGTRCHQLAEYVIFESPLNMLCDSPSNYDREQECVDYIASVPTVWDETVALDGKIAEYIVIARRYGEAWFVGGLNNWDPREVEITLPVAFRGKQIDVFSDGMNAGRVAEDYSRTTVDVPDDGVIIIHMASGGGWAASLK